MVDLYNPAMGWDIETESKSVHVLLYVFSCYNASHLGQLVDFFSSSSRPLPRAWYTHFVIHDGVCFK